MPEQSENKRLVLVDGSSYLFRAYHALPPLTTTRGQATGAVKGVINMVRRLMKDYPDSPVAVVFDAKGKTFRSKLFEEYKAHRPPMPDDLRSQIEPIHKIIEAMGLPLIVEPGVEADDVIGTLAQQAKKLNMPTLISTGDKDLAQLVDEHVTLLNTMTQEVLDVEGVINKFGLPPEKIVDYLGLMGDKSDNIPGVPGVGPKTAIKWLQEYGSVRELIVRADEIKGKAGENLRENIELLKLSCQLATIKLDCDLPYTPTDLVHKPENKSDLLALYKSLEFRTWVQELEDEGVKASRTDPLPQSVIEAEPTPPEADWFPEPETVDYNVISSIEELQDFIGKVPEMGYLAFSLETNGQHYKLAEIVGLSLCLDPGRAIYIPFAHEGLTAQLSADAALACLKPVFENNKVFKVGQDLKFCSHVLANYGIGLRGARFDTMLQSYVLNSVAHRHRLENLAPQFLNRDKIRLDDLLGKGRGKLTYSQLPLETACEYSAQNADFCFRLFQGLQHHLESTGRLAEVYRYLEAALFPVLGEMERHGIKIDTKILAVQGAELEEKLENLEQEAYALAGDEFNLGSPKQLQEILYGKLAYPVLSKTAKGQPSTAEPVLQELAADFPLPKLLLEHRSLSKLKSTYVDKLPLEIREDTGRIHTCFQQAVAATGRLSSTEPNLQNIPIRTLEGRRIRQAFVAEKGKLLMAADYSQVELRIMAHLSGDKGLRHAFSTGLDIHRATAAEIFDVPVDDISADQRRSAKAINFGLIYGMSAFGLAKQLGIGRHEAQDYVERYFHRYPGVRDYMENTRLLASEQGYVETLFGRRLYLPDIHARNGMLRKAAERTAINAPMQGTAADIIKQAMIDIAHWLEVDDLDAKMVLQVHDELVFEVAEADLDLLSQGVVFRMVSAASLDVPLVVDVGSGKNWDEAH